MSEPCNASTSILMRAGNDKRNLLALIDRDFKQTLGFGHRQAGNAENFLPAFRNESLRVVQRLQKFGCRTQCVSTTSEPKGAPVRERNQLRLFFVTAHTDVSYVCRKLTKARWSSVVLVCGLDPRCHIPDSRECATCSEPHRRGSQHREVIRLLVPSPIFPCGDPHRRSDRGYGSDGLRPARPIAATEFAPGNVFVAERAQQHSADHGHIPVDDLLHLYPAFFRGIVA